ncbi:Inosine-5'-monophosphate dehydrogenase [Candidatus Burarchaeum australiense]|nr:Inosine-5'-monophosphate dehydrogenase [Candidatus Burarchaeum australiense]
MSLNDKIREAVFIDYDEPVSKAVPKMRQTGVSLLVMKEGKYRGLLDDRQVGDVIVAEAKAGTLAVKTPVLSLKDGPLEAARLFTTGKFKVLPVIERGKIVGVIARADLMRELAEEKLLAHAKAKDIMNTPVVTVDAGESVARARGIMRKACITHVVVTENGKAVGTFSTYDLFMDMTRPHESLPFVREKLSIETQPVRSFFRRLDGIRKEATLKECALMMAEHDISELVVVDGNTPVGIVVANDIFKMLNREPGPKIEVSGLMGDDKQYMEEVIEQAEKALITLGREFPIESLTLHMKKHGKDHTVQAHVRTGGKMVAVTGEAWDIYEAVKQALVELKKILMKGKRSKKGGIRPPEF